MTQIAVDDIFEACWLQGYVQTHLVSVKGVWTQMHDAVYPYVYSVSCDLPLVISLELHVLASEESCHSSSWPVLYIPCHRGLNTVARKLGIACMMWHLSVFVRHALMLQWNQQLFQPYPTWPVCKLIYHLFSHDLLLSLYCLLFRKDAIVDLPKVFDIIISWIYYCDGRRSLEAVLFSSLFWVWGLLLWWLSTPVLYLFQYLLVLYLVWVGPRFLVHCHFWFVCICFVIVLSFVSGPRACLLCLNKI